MNADDVKRCSKCWRYLPFSAFVEDKRTRDRLSYRCAECKGREPEPIERGQ